MEKFLCINYLVTQRYTLYLRENRLNEWFFPFICNSWRALNISKDGHWCLFELFNSIIMNTHILTYLIIFKSITGIFIGQIVPLLASEGTFRMVLGFFRHEHLWWTFWWQDVQAHFVHFQWLVWKWLFLQQVLVPFRGNLYLGITVGIPQVKLLLIGFFSGQN